MGYEKCLFCWRDVTVSWSGGSHSDGQGWVNVQLLSCPFCNHTSVRLVVEDQNRIVTSTTVVHPLGVKRPVPPEVPEKYASLFRDACAVIGISEKSSAALSRRCLQTLLEDDLKVKARPLSDQIEEAGSSLPDDLRKALHVVREIGNFAAHPIKSEHPGVLVDVEPDEAAWSLECLSALFDHQFVKPARERTRHDEFNEKLVRLGRKPI
jgi:hypothetical protein